MSRRPSPPPARGRRYNRRSSSPISPSRATVRMLALPASASSGPVRYPDSATLWMTSQSFATMLAHTPSCTCTHTFGQRSSTKRPTCNVPVHIMPDLLVCMHSGNLGLCTHARAPTRDVLTDVRGMHASLDTPPRRRHARRACGGPARPSGCPSTHWILRHIGARPLHGKAICFARTGCYPPFAGPRTHQWAIDHPRLKAPVKARAVAL